MAALWSAEGDYIGGHSIVGQGQAVPVQGVNKAGLATQLSGYILRFFMYAASEK